MFKIVRVHVKIGGIRGKSRCFWNHGRTLFKKGQSRVIVCSNRQGMKRIIRNIFVKNNVARCEKVMSRD